MVASSLPRKAKENGHLNNLIASMEGRYKNITDDHVVDLNNLQVVRTRSGRISKPRSIYTKHVATFIKPAIRGSLSSSTASNSSSGFSSMHSTPNTSNTRPGTEIMFDRSLQTDALKSLLETLRLGGTVAELVKKRLIKRGLLTLGRDTLPNLSNVRPFFTFHGSEEIGVTFLFDTPDLTPWTMICLKFFGQENVELYQQIYHIISQKETPKNTGKQNLLQPRMITSTPNARRTDFSMESSQFNGLTIRAQDESWNCYSGMGNSKNAKTSTRSETKQSKDASNMFGEQITGKKLSNSSFSPPTGSESCYSIKPLWHCTGDSIVYKNDVQRSSLQKLLEIVRAKDDESEAVKRKLLERAHRALGMSTGLPASGAKPFFTFHERGEIGVSFLFDQTSLSPWSAICDLYFGKEILNLCSEIYKIITMPKVTDLEKLELLGQSYSPSSFDSRASKSLNTIEPRSNNRSLRSIPLPSKIVRNSSSVITTLRKARLSLSPSMCNSRLAIRKSRGTVRLAAIKTMSLGRGGQCKSGSLGDDCSDDLAELALPVKGRKARKSSTIPI